MPRSEPLYTPTEREIEIQCALIREKWSKRELRKRCCFPILKHYDKTSRGIHIYFDKVEGGRK